MRSRRRTRNTLAHAVGLVLLVACGSTPAASPQDTIGLGGGLGDPGSTSPDGEPVGAAPPLSPLGVSSSCIAQIEGDLRQQMVSPSAAASVRTDHWLSLEQLATYGEDDGTAPLDGWLSMSCTLPNGDTVTARTLDSTPIEQVPVTPATHVVAPGLPDDDRVVVDPSGAATLTVLVTVNDVLFAPVEGGTAVVSTFDGDEIVVTVSALLVEVEPLAEPRSIALDASFRASCGEPYGGCGA